MFASCVTWFPTHTLKTQTYQVTSSPKSSVVLLPSLLSVPFSWHERGVRRDTFAVYFSWVMIKWAFLYHSPWFFSGWGRDGSGVKFSFSVSFLVAFLLPNSINITQKRTFQVEFFQPLVGFLAADFILRPHDTTLYGQSAFVLELESSAHDNKRNDFITRDKMPSVPWLNSARQSSLPQHSAVVRRRENSSFFHHVMRRDLLRLFCHWNERISSSTRSHSIVAGNFLSEKTFSCERRALKAAWGVDRERWKS